MHVKTIPILIEKTYSSSKWCSDAVHSVKQEATRYDYSLNIIDPEKIREYCVNYIMILGTDAAWIYQTVRQIHSVGGRALLICGEPAEVSEKVSYIAPDRGDMVTHCLQYLSGAGRKKTALFGFNPSAASDMIREKVYFEQAVKYGVNAAESCVYRNDGSLEECFRRFIRHIKEYDSVICANDAAAVYLIREIGTYGITIPDDLFVIGNGNTKMGSMIQPSLTTITLNYEEVGRQAVNLYKYLSTQPSIHSLRATVSCGIIARESTGFFRPGAASEKPKNLDYPRDQFFSDPEIRRFFLLENLFCGCDEIDMKIMEGLTHKTEYEKMAEQLYISVYTLKYRLKKIFKAADVRTREQFVNLVKQYRIKL